MQPTDQAPRGFTGTISLRLTDLIQMVCLSGSDLVIQVNSRSGTGSVYIVKGQIHNAQTDSSFGEDAFFEILRWSDGRFEVLPHARETENLINKPWEHLLLETMRLRDENDVAGRAYPGPEGDGIDLGDIFGAMDSIDDAGSPEAPAKSPRQPERSIKVLIVDDSPFFSKKLKEMLEEDPGIEVVGTAGNGAEMLAILESGTSVDLITLDVEMPVMPGETTIKHIMINHRQPVLIVSSLQSRGMEKILEFLQLGAVDFAPKPGASQDRALYAANLRGMVKGASLARLSNFRRLRKQSGPAPAIKIDDGPVSGNVIVVVGAQGAHMDWFRLPWRSLWREGLLIGLQNLQDSLVAPFAGLIESRSGLKVSPLMNAQKISHGALYLGNASFEASFSLSAERSFIEMRAGGSGALDWNAGLHLWLSRLAEQFSKSLRLYFLSGIDPLPDSLTVQLLAGGAKLILAPPDSVLCSRLTDSIHPYAGLFPGQVLFSGPDNLLESLK